MADRVISRQDSRSPFLSWRSDFFAPSLSSGAIIALAIIAMALCSPRSARAADSLHVQIDKVIADSHVSVLAARANDEEFLRRIYLDLSGTIPTAPQARAFFADKTPDKRTKLIDHLLASPQFARHMANTFDVMMMERRGDKHVKTPEWRKYLYDSVLQNKPYNQMAREILGADGADPKLRPAAKFYLDREGEANLLTRDLGRIFFGMDLQCAQCHDHPLIDDYYQSDYYGIFAFINRSYVYADKKAKKSFFAEKGEGLVSFQSVFDPDNKKNSGPKLPSGTELTIPVFKKGEEYTVKPAKDVRPIPKYSVRAQLAQLTTDGSNRAFNENIANRLWSHMMGRGLVHPADLNHADNPSAHPQLSRLMGESFAAMKFDVRAYLRELALTETYQRSFEMPQGLAAQLQAVEARLPTWVAEDKNLSDQSDKSETAAEKATADLEAAKGAIPPINAELTKANAAGVAAKQASDKAVQTLAATQKLLAAKQDISKTVTEAAVKVKEAAAKLSGEKDLADAAAKFEARSKQLIVEAAALAKTTADQTAASKAAADKTAAAVAAVSAITTRLTAAQQKLKQWQVTSAGITLNAKAHFGAYQSSKRRVADAKQFIEYCTLRIAADASQQAIEKQQATLAISLKTKDQLAVDLPKRKTQLPVLQQSRDKTAKAMADLQKLLVVKSDIAKVVSEASVKAEAALKKLPGDVEITAAAAKVKTRQGQLTAELAALQKTFTTVSAASKTAANQFAAMQKSIADGDVQLAALTKQIPMLQAQIKPLTDKATADQAGFELAFSETTQRWTKQFAVGSLKPLTPEQMAWSMMAATGMLERQQIASQAELDKKTPPTEATKKDSAQIALRSNQLEQMVYDKLKGNEGQFVKLFGAGAGQPQTEFFATVDQALFFANGGQVRSWLTASGGNLADRLNKLEDPQSFSEELYRSVFTRQPTAGEAADVKQYLTQRAKERPAAVQEIIWALLTSSEFRFNH